MMTRFIKMLRSLDKLFVVLLISSVIQLATCVHHDLAKTEPANPQSHTSHSHNGHTGHNHVGSPHGQHTDHGRPKSTNVDIHGQPTRQDQHCESHVDRAGEHGNLSPMSVIHRECKPHGHGAGHGPGHGTGHGTGHGDSHGQHNPLPVTPHQNHQCESHVDRAGEHGNFSPVSVIHRECHSHGHGTGPHGGHPGHGTEPHGGHPGHGTGTPGGHPGHGTGTPGGHPGHGTGTPGAHHRQPPTSLPVSPTQLPVLPNHGHGGPIQSNFPNIHQRVDLSFGTVPQSGINLITNTPPLSQWSPDPFNPMLSISPTPDAMPGAMQFPFEPPHMGPFSPTSLGVMPMFPGAMRMGMDPRIVARRRGRRRLVLRRLERLEAVNTQLLRLLTGLVGRLSTSG